MSVQDVVKQLIREDAQRLRAVFRDCESCLEFVRKARSSAKAEMLDWSDVPDELLGRFSEILRKRLFHY